jgi:hypothetical protein
MPTRHGEPTAIELRDLTRDEKTALVALLDYMVEANASVTDEESEKIDSIVSQLGADDYRTIGQEVDERFPDEESLKAFLTTISRQEARELIYGTTLSAAMSDAMRPEESELLDWLADEWDIQVQFEAPDGDN